jgi:AcrR family transcriptional regulator
MGRKPRISDNDLTQAAARVCARLGPGRVTIDTIAKEAGVPVGSVYHRVDSRAALLAEVWINAAQGFSADFLPKLADANSADAAAEAALITPRFARVDHAGAVALLAYRRDDFLDGAADEARARAAKLSADLQQGLADAARRLIPNDRRGRERIAVALIGVPYGAVRVFLPQATPPAELDPVILAAARAALAHRA